MKTLIAMILVVGCGAFGQLSPIAYTNRVSYIRYQRITNYITKTVGTNTLCVGYQIESTNWPSAITHCVTYGNNTNAVFKLFSTELLLSPTNVLWQNAEWKQYREWTWITGTTEEWVDE